MMKTSSVLSGVLESGMNGVSKGVLKGILVVAGVLAIAIGASILLNPIGFHASSGIQLPGDSSLLSEVRAPGGTLMVAGVLMTVGAFVASLQTMATVIGALVYLSYGVSRVLSMFLDGLPSDSLVAATAIELVIGLACVGYLALTRRTLYE
ncbi:DUF4345 domain-containing protein [Aurantivibrio plasticivorans]